MKFFQFSDESEFQRIPACPPKMMMGMHTRACKCVFVCDPSSVFVCLFPCYVCVYNCYVCVCVCVFVCIFGCVWVSLYVDVDVAVVVVVVIVVAAVVVVAPKCKSFTSDSKTMANPWMTSL